MPEYLAPGVYVEETSFRNKTIEGVSTSTAGFVGPARFGPFEGEPELLTSFADFERIYGGVDQLKYSGTEMCNFLALAVRAFFEEGGKRLYVSRVYKLNGKSKEDGCAEATITDLHSPPAGDIDLKMRYPGAAGNVTVTFVVERGQNILSKENNHSVLRGAANYDVVYVKNSGELYWIERYYDESSKRWSFRLRQDNPADDASSALLLSSLSADTDKVYVITVNVTVGAMGKFMQELNWEKLAFHPQHRNALTKVFAADPRNRSTALYVPLTLSTSLKNGKAIAATILSQASSKSASSTLMEALAQTDPSVSARTYEVLLKKGSDGVRPQSTEYKGQEDSQTGLKSGLKAFEDLEDISIVAAPGSTYGYSNSYQTATDSIIRYLISHCEGMRYRIAVLDSPEKQVLSEIRDFRGKLDSKHAALYYPWVTILDPLTNEEINQPPSGFVAGIYARNDVDHGVHKAPANEVVRGAIGFEALLNKAQQDVLNPEGINCLRFFEGRGYRLWGARTISSDPEWKYVNLRRYFAYLERSIEKHTQWVVFENNSEPLWANVSSTVEDFLFNEWKSGHLMGEKSSEAYFVRCDRSTMTQNDIDNGRMICLIGVAPVRPAEFVIFRIGQWTANRRS
jgi:phage tail sheath protein FI